MREFIEWLSNPNFIVFIVLCVILYFVVQIAIWAWDRVTEPAAQQLEINPGVPTIAKVGERLVPRYPTTDLLEPVELYGNRSSQNMEHLHKWSKTNWALVSYADRMKCLDHLRQKLPPEFLAKIKAQVYEGRFLLCEDDRFFHFGYGMLVRNLLRDVLPDNRLPLLMDDSGSNKNWDDFYIGALYELAERELAEDPL